jgi:hypothetical protein
VVEEMKRLAGADPVAMAALNEVLEAFLSHLGPKASREYLRAIAGRIESDPSAIPIRNPTSAADTLAARAWLQQRLPSWLTKHG